ILGRDKDGIEGLLLPKLFILWLTIVSTDSAKLIPLGKDITAIETLKKIPPSYIHNALTVSLVVSTTFVEQFWMSAKSKIINNVRYITAKVAGKPVSISEASIRSDLWKRIFKKRTKRKPKTNKTEHEMEKCEKTKSNRSQSQSKSKSQQKSQPRQSQSQP
ncbi:hypothetical protein Tco_1510693, partial [Tanacetum coccineum]